MRRYLRALLAAIAAVRPAWNRALAPDLAESLEAFQVYADLGDGRGLRLLHSSSDERRAAVEAELRLRQRCSVVAFWRNGVLEWVRTPKGKA